MECVALLLSVGQISLNKTNKLGDSPASLAAIHGRSHCLDLLLQVSSFAKTMGFALCKKNFTFFHSFEGEG